LGDIPVEARIAVLASKSTQTTGNQRKTMSGFVIEPPTVTTLPVQGSDDLFPVSEIYCVGRNYADHAIEMGHDPDREAPFFFMKPRYTVLTSKQQMQYPSHSQDVHHEVELVVALKSGGQNISVADAVDHIFGYGVGIDMTRRDLQGQAKEKSRPWESGKTFLHASPCSELVSIEQSGQLNEGNIQLRVNDELRQEGNLNQMIWKVSEVISRLSELFYLQAGDLIYTGTPAGVGPIARGDRLTAIIENVTRLDLEVAQG